MTKTGRPFFDGKTLKVGVFEFLSGADVIETFSKREPHTHYPLMTETESRLDVYPGQGARIRDELDERLLLTYIGPDSKTAGVHSVAFQKENNSYQPVGERTVLKIGPQDAVYKTFRVHVESYDSPEGMITLNVTREVKQQTAPATK